MITKCKFQNCESGHVLHKQGDEVKGIKLLLQGCLARYIKKDTSQI